MSVPTRKDHTMASGGPVFDIPIAAATLSTGGPWDLFGLTASSSSRLEIQRIEITLQTSQFSTFPGLAFLLITGSTGSSTGAAITPVNVRRHSGVVTAPFTATGPSSTVVSTASATLLFAGALDPTRFVYQPREQQRPILGLSGNCFVRTTTPSIAAIVNVTATVQELGKGLPT
jgi:hypothetical protein